MPSFIAILAGQTGGSASIATLTDADANDERLSYPGGIQTQRLLYLK